MVIEIRRDCFWGMGISEVMKMSYELTGVQVKGVNRFVKTHLIVHLKFVHFTGFKLYLNKIKINLHYLKINTINSNTQ